LGCTYSSEYEAGGTAQAEASGSAQAQPQAQAAEPAPEPQAAAQGDGIDRSGLAYAGLLSLGNVSRCDVTLHSLEGDRQLLMLMDGKGMLRIDEAQTGSAECSHLVVVFKVDSEENGMLYTKCQGSPDALGTEFGTHERCDWISMDVEAQWGGVGSTVRGIQLPDGSNIGTPFLDQLSDYSCSAWDVDASQFDTSGYVCD